MKIIETYSHLNGLEYLLVHKPKLWRELQMNASFKELLTKANWKKSRVSYWVTKDKKLIRKTLSMDPKDQKKVIEETGETSIYSYNQTDFVK